MFAPVRTGGTQGFTPGFHSVPATEQFQPQAEPQPVPTRGNPAAGAGLRPRQLSVLILKHGAVPTPANTDNIADVFVQLFLAEKKN